LEEFSVCFTKEAKNQRITKKKSHFPKEFSTNSSHFPKEFKASFLYRGKFFKKISPIKEISCDFSSFIKENVVSLHPD